MTIKSTRLTLALFNCNYAVWDPISVFDETKLWKTPSVSVMSVEVNVYDVPIKSFNEGGIFIKTFEKKEIKFSQVKIIF